MDCSFIPQMSGRQLYLTTAATENVRTATTPHPRNMIMCLGASETLIRESFIFFIVMNIKVIRVL